MFRLATFTVLLLSVTFWTGRGAADTPRSEMTYQIKTTWDGRPIDHDPVTVTFIGRGSEGVEIKVDAPFFGVPGNPGGEPGKPFDKLWEYEVVEAFFADGDAEKPKYLEVELCPWGQHLVLLLDGVHNAVGKLLPLQFTALKNSTRWTGSAIVPATYFPPRVTRFNAYAIHDVNGVEGDPRRYESLFPVPTGKYENADFHRLEYFKPLDFGSLQPGNNDAEPSYPWPLTKSLVEEHDNAEKTNSESINTEAEMNSIRVAPNVIKINTTLIGGNRPKSNVILTLEGSVFAQEAELIINLSASIPDNGSKVPAGPVGTPMPEEDLDSYETLRVYLANEDRKVLELIFSPTGQYDVKICSAPYNVISRGHRIPINMYNTDKNLWIIKAKVPLNMLPAKISKVLLAAVFTIDGKVQYETTYSISNAGISLKDLLILNKYALVTGLFPKGVNDAYSDLWDTGK